MYILEFRPAKASPPMKTYYRRMLQTHIIDAYHRRISQTRIIDAYYRRGLQMRIIDAYYGRILQTHIIEAYYSRILQIHIIDTYYRCILQTYIIDAHYRRIYYNEKVRFQTSGDVPPTKMNMCSTRNPIFDVPEAQSHEKITFSLNRLFWTSQKDTFTLDREQKSTFRSRHQLALRSEGSRTSPSNIYIYIDIYIYIYVYLYIYKPGPASPAPPGQRIAHT